MVIDTSNYFPHRDGVIEGLGDGQPEGLWVQGQYRHPIVKAWNTITTASFADEATEPGASNPAPLRVHDRPHRRSAPRSTSEGRCATCCPSRVFMIEILKERAEADDGN